VPDPFDSKGYAWQLGLDYEIPLQDWNFGPAVRIKQSLTLGADVKQTNNNIEFSSTPVTDNTTRIIQLRAGWNGSFQDRFGNTSLSVTAVASPGGIGAYNDDASFAASRARAEAKYAYANVDLRRTTALPHGFSHVLGFTAQIASGNLLGSEQLGFGGAHSVRGYDEGIVFGDQGILLHNELVAPPFHLLGRLGKFALRDSVTLLGFWDYGVARNRELLVDEDPNVILASIGVGIRYQLANRLSAQFDYGWQQKDPGFTTRETHGRGHVSVNYTW
jgi:hemolysin activation/secretion protein